jgi:hypothetical protein
MKSVDATGEEGRSDMSYKGLVVSEDPWLRRQIRLWLLEAGAEVTACSGPLAPDYVCIVGTGEMCPLASDVDFVILDSHLAGDGLMRGMPAWQLLDYYHLNLALPVVLLERERGVAGWEDELVVRVSYPPERSELTQAMHQLLSRLPAKRRVIA